MQRLTHVTCFFLIVCGWVINVFWPFVEGIGIRDLETHGASKNSQKGPSNITYSWFLENPNEFVKGESSNNDTNLIGTSIPYKIEDEDYKLTKDTSYYQRKHHDLLYLDQVGIWVKFHDYASNVDILVESTQTRNTLTDSSRKYGRLLEDQIKGNLSRNGSNEDLGLHSLRKNGRKGGWWLFHSFFQVVSKDWLLGWNFICNYFKEFILK
ncbi:unnamed protein product [Cryptosporidium hominis]|uniref:Uncharacterized protein n=1 Tax=Cryptosporidium hominis TaxID=237895 RepID=A0A0S4TJF0_CRYHO|nr:transmembrane protein [Cryptosporidium hominis TU502]OLQ16060.1 hypothetical protein ChTU502y2012_316g0010 [Cryptosporidium hominis]PPA62421.1 hypothetical protein ChUKH1_12915 [Cryptosporidium hominis]PPS97393.1 Uncharacterized protein GY17_00000394 [Cryptosporidium hominis]CUV06803.1 unnamed protein product [Cryptosporidium hominis]|eukprot:PPS97393.1 Uncharacterized protein GY17_00000394 [Cryptosporidium hominis]